jgi:hypothetical protein
MSRPAPVIGRDNEMGSVVLSPVLSASFPESTSRYETFSFCRIVPALKVGLETAQCRMETTR